MSALLSYSCTAVGNRESRPAKAMDRKKARMTDDPGNSSQAATIRRPQGLRAAGEARILGRLKYFERYSEKGRVPVVRTQSAFGLQSMWGNQKSEERQEGDFGPRNLLADFRSAGRSSLDDVIVGLLDNLLHAGNAHECRRAGIRCRHQQEVEMSLTRGAVS